MRQQKSLDTSRRTFLRVLAALAAGGHAFLRSGSVAAAIEEATMSTTGWPQMEYRPLGRTGFKGSRLVFGCGAALSRGQAVNLLEPALAAGINVFDVGFREYYRDAESNLAPFLKRHRDEVFLISKAMLNLDEDADEYVPSDHARAAAKRWTNALENSLKELEVEHVDAYYMMATNNPSIVQSDEMYLAFVKAREAGKVKHFGISSHENAQAVVEAAIAAGWYDLMQIAITPAGWYDWNKKMILEGTPSMVALKPLLDRARESGIGLIGMKAGRHLAGRGFLMGGDLTAYDKYYDERFMARELSAFQRSYAYVLAHGLDAVNADLQTFALLKENFLAAARSHEFFAA